MYEDLETVLTIHGRLCTVTGALRTGIWQSMTFLGGRISTGALTRTMGQFLKGEASLEPEKVKH